MSNDQGPTRNGSEGSPIATATGYGNLEAVIAGGSADLTH